MFFVIETKESALPKGVATIIILIILLPLCVIWSLGLLILKCGCGIFHVSNNLSMNMKVRQALLNMHMYQLRRN